MGVQLPSEPITRKERYLAKAAGQAVEVPAEPITREEAYLNAIAHGGGGGGGTSNYNDLSNQPQINGNTLIGNKSASDLGLVAEENGKGLSTNDYSNTDKAIVEGVTAALEGKQDVLTAGDYIQFDGNEISVKRDISKEDSRVVVNVYGHNDSVIDVTVTQDGEQISSETYSLHTLSTVNIANVAELYTPSYPFIAVRNLVDSTEHPAGYVEEMWMGSVPRYEQTYIVKAYEDKKLIIQSELDAEIDAIKDGANIESFAGVETALALKQDKTDNNLQTTDKTIVGAINEHEGDIDSLKSGLTNKEPLGGATTGNKTFAVGGNLKLMTDAEGGNINIVSDNNVQFEIDAHTDILRVWSDKSGSYKFLTWNGNEDINLNDLVNKEPLNGTDTGNKIFHVGNKLYLKTDNEGGNIVIKSPTNITYEADAYNGSFRFRTTKSGEGKSITWDGMRNVNLNAMPSIYHGTVTSDSVYGSIGVPNATNSLIVLVGNDSKSYHLDYNNPNVFILRDENNVAVTDTSVEIMAMYVQ